jgi:hypothetical protein
LRSFYLLRADYKNDTKKQEKGQAKWFLTKRLTAKAGFAMGLIFVIP